MKVKLLGTGASEGIPAGFCSCKICEYAREKGGKDLKSRNQALLNDKYLIDFPQDTYYHTVVHNVNLGKIEHAIITHAHEDHFYPFELNHRCPPFNLAPTDYPLNIYGPSSVVEKYNKLSPPIEDKYVRVHRLKAFNQYNVDELKLIPLPANHGGEDMESFIYIIESGGKRLLYGTDSGPFLAESLEAMAGLYFDCLILDSNSGFEPAGPYHMNINDNIDLVESLRDLACVDNKSQVLLTHLNHNSRLIHEDFERLAKENGFIAAYDGIELEF